MINEYYANLKGYENLYKISNYGTIKSLDKEVKNKNGYRIIKGKILKAKKDKYGYFIICLTKNGKQTSHRVHRLVAETFIPNPNNYPVINHKDGDKQNNYTENLEWCTYKQNTKHAYDTGLKKGKSAEHKGNRNPNSKLTEEDIVQILKDKKNNVKRKESYLKYKDRISFSGFEQIWDGYRWKHLVEKVGE